MYRQPMTSSVPGRSTVNVNPVRSAKSRACLSRSRRLASSDMPSTGGQPQDSKPGVARICAMLDIHAAWSDSLCCAPSGTRWNSGASSSRGGSKSSGTNGLALTVLETTAGVSSCLTVAIRPQNRTFGRKPTPAADPSAGAVQAVGELAQVLGQLGWLVDLEVGREHRDAHRQPAQVVVAGAQLAAVVVDRRDRAPRRVDVRGGRVDGDPRLVAVGHPADALLHVRRRVADRELALREPNAHRRRLRDAVDAE